MAVKIVRQANQIALIGAPSSAAGRSAGMERGPAALRAAGLADRLRAAGYQITDLGDCPTYLYKPDEDSPRARNTRAVVACLEAVRPKVEQAFKAGALPLVLGGDCTIALGTLAGLRRYLGSVGLLYFDRDADLNTPETTPSGCFDGMGVAHIIGRGAPELVRFWSEPPLVREPDIALFGLERLDPPEEKFLARSPIRRYLASDIRRQGAAAAAQAALTGLRANRREFALHIDVDVISGEDFRATDLPGDGGLGLEDVRQALEVCASHPNLVALEIAAYSPEVDGDNQGAALLVELLVSALTSRRRALTKPPAETRVAAAAGSAGPAEASNTEESLATQIAVFSGESPAPEPAGSIPNDGSNDRASESVAPEASSRADEPAEPFPHQDQPSPEGTGPDAKQTSPDPQEQERTSPSNE